MELHEGNLFFKHKYPTLDIECALERIGSFDKFEEYFFDDLLSENLLMGEYLYYLLDWYGIEPPKATLKIGKLLDILKSCK